MGLFRFLNQWREKKDGTLEGPALSTDRIGSADYKVEAPDWTHADIQSLIDDLHGDGDDVSIEFAGHFQHASEIVPRPNIDLFGYNATITVTEQVNAIASDYTTSFTDQSEAGDLENVTIAGFTLDGDRASFTDDGDSHTHSGIWTPLARDIVIEDITAMNWHGHGVHPDAVIDSRVEAIKAINCDIGIHPGTRNNDNGVIYGPQNSKFLNLHAEASDSIGVSVSSADGCVISEATVKGSGGGIGLSGRENTLTGCTLLGDGSGTGINISANSTDTSGGTSPSRNNTVTGNTLHNYQIGLRGTDALSLTARNNPMRGIDGRAYWLEGNSNDAIIGDISDFSGGYAMYVEGTAARPTVKNVNCTGSVNADVYVGSSITDLDIADSNVGTIDNSGTRTRWNGVIAGGPLGGVDLSTVSGQYQGDKAMSNGTNSTAYLDATWTGSAWQPSDGGATL